MNKQLVQRLEALEARRPSKGVRTLFTCDSTPATFAEFAPGTPYQHFHPDPFGSWHESATLHTQAHVDAMAAEGWQVIVVNYTSRWRAGEGVVHLDSD